MSGLHWELSVLSRAILYSNLSSASLQVGLSQPQLSRIVARLEVELDIVLLDREAKRKSGWTPLAYKLAQSFIRSNQSWNDEVQRLVTDAEPHFLRIGTLEGLSEIASAFAKHVFKTTAVKTVELDVHDLNKLEELFLNNSLDIIFTSRGPSRKKFKYLKVLGYQSLENQGTGPFKVMSSFEYASQAKTKKNEDSKILVSNSLEIRKSWVHQHGGRGIIPSKLNRQKQSSSRAGENEAVMLAVDTFSPKVWKKISEFEF